MDKEQIITILNFYQVPRGIWGLSLWCLNPDLYLVKFFIDEDLIAIKLHGDEEQDRTDLVAFIEGTMKEYPKWFEPKKVNMKRVFRG